MNSVSANVASVGHKYPYFTILESYCRRPGLCNMTLSIKTCPFAFHYFLSMRALGTSWLWFIINTLRPRQNGRHFPDDIFKCIFLIENVWISIKISLKFVPMGPINNNPVLVPIMAWRRLGDKPLSEPMMVGLTTHICVTRPQWVNRETRVALVSLWRNVSYLCQQCPLSLCLHDLFYVSVVLSHRCNCSITY